MLAERDERQDSLVRIPPSTLIAAEALRVSAPVEAQAKNEDKIPAYWRIFGGTTLSIAALVCITVYQQFNNGINDLRKEVNGQHEARADLVKKDELNNRLTPMWTGIKEGHAAAAEINGLKERCAMLLEQLKNAEQERKLLAGEVQQMRDRLVRLETQREPKTQKQ